MIVAIVWNQQHNVVVVVPTFVWWRHQTKKKKHKLQYIRNILHGSRRRRRRTLNQQDTIGETNSLTDWIGSAPTTKNWIPSTVYRTVQIGHRPEQQFWFLLVASSSFIFVWNRTGMGGMDFQAVQCMAQSFIYFLLDDWRSTAALRFRFEFQSIVLLFTPYLSIVLG